MYSDHRGGASIFSWWGHCKHGETAKRKRPFDHRGKDEYQTQRRLFLTDDAREGMNAFMEKRSVVYRNRSR